MQQGDHSISPEDDCRMTGCDVIFVSVKTSTRDVFVPLKKRFTEIHFQLVLHTLSSNNGSFFENTS